MSTTVPVQMRTPDRSHLVNVELSASDEVLLTYARHDDLDRETAGLRRVREVHRVDPGSGSAELLSTAEFALPTPSFREFRDRTPEESSWFGGALVIVPEEFERRYTFIVDGPEGSPSLPVAVRASYGERPDSLRLTVLGPAGRRDWRFRLTALDLSRGMTPEVLRRLSAMRWDGERYVTYFDSILDVRTGERLRLLEDVPTTFVELVTVDPDWTRVLLVFGTQRVDKELVVTPLVLPTSASD